MCEFCRVVPVAAKGLWFAESDSREGAFDDLNEETKENYFRSATYMILALKENFFIVDKPPTGSWEPVGLLCREVEK